MKIIKHPQIKVHGYISYIYISLSYITCGGHNAGSTLTS